MSRPVPRAVTLSEHPEHRADARRLVEEYIRLPDAWTRFGGVPDVLPAYFRELDDFPGEAAPPGGEVVVSIIEPDVVGVGLVVPGVDDVCEFKRVFVVAGHRGTGIGRALAATMSDRARTLAYRRVRIDVMPERPAAVAFWTALGFEPCAPFRDYRFDMLFMDRLLD